MLKNVQKTLISFGLGFELFRFYQKFKENPSNKHIGKENVNFQHIFTPLLLQTSLTESVSSQKV
jgi:hypothetical protein